MIPGRVMAGLLGAALLTCGLYAGEKTQSFSVKKGETLEVRADAGEIKVHGWNKDEIFVRVQSLNDDQLKSVTMSQGGGTVLVEYRRSRHSSEDMQFDISVPSSFNIDVHTAGGGIEVQGPLSGDLKGNTAGGSITLGDLGGKVQMETAGGEITEGSVSGDLRLSTAGGDVSVKNVTGAAEVSTAGGTITIGDVGSSLRVSTAGGDIRVGKVAGELNVSTAGGSIQVLSGRGNVSMSTAGGSITMESGQGRISASTSAGNILLRDIEGSVFARSNAGNIDVTLDPSVGKESSSMATSAGNVVLRIPPNAKATINARARGVAGTGEEDETGIQSDYPVTRPGARHGETQAEVVLNGGGQRILLETMIGSISIRKPK